MLKISKNGIFLIFYSFNILTISFNLYNENLRFFDTILFTTLATFSPKSLSNGVDVQKSLKS